jgi:YD repeat-containing protein
MLPLNCHVAGRLSQVLEPEGEARFCYDEFGRETRNAHFIRPSGIGGTPPPERFGEIVTEYSPSGLELRSTADDGFIQANGFDTAGRLVSVRRLDAAGGPSVELWAADEMDGAGRIRREHYGNGVVETYEHDALGLAKDIRVSSGATDLYHVLVEERTPYGAPTRVTDAIHPGAATGLDQSQTFAYDGAGRLVEATVGRFSSTSDDQFAFAYGYDSLQNMTFRKVCGPKSLGELTTEYHYGERGKGPRQLTTVLPEMP